MLIPTTHNLASLRHTAIASMAAYLSVAPLARHADLIRTELLEQLAEQDLTLDTIKVALGSADPVIYAHLISRGTPLEKVGPITVDGYRAFDPLHLPHLEPERRLALFALLSQTLPSCSDKLELWLARTATLHHDIAFFDAIVAWAQHTTPAALAFTDQFAFLKSERNATPEAAVFWEQVLDRLDPADTGLSQIAIDAFHTRDVHRIALLITLGVDLAPAAAPTLEGCRNDANTPAWLLRLLTKALSNHGRLALHTVRMPVAEILAMPTAHLQVRLGGLSNRQRRVIKRKRRARKFPQSLRLLLAASGEIV